PEASGHYERKSFPQRDKYAEFGAEGVQIGNASAWREPKLVSQWLRTETPISFEIVGTRADLAPAEIKHPKTALASAAHDLPIHKIVSGQLASFCRAAAVIG